MCQTLLAENRFVYQTLFVENRLVRQTILIQIVFISCFPF